MIQELYQDNLSLHKELSKQVRVVDEAEKYQEERNKILADNRELNSKVQKLEKDYQNKASDLEWDYKSKIKHLEKEKNHLHKVINKFWNILGQLINWICEKFDIAEEDNIVRDF